MDATGDTPTTILNPPAPSRNVSTPGLDVEPRSYLRRHERPHQVTNAIQKLGSMANVNQITATITFHRDNALERNRKPKDIKPTLRGYWGTRPRLMPVYTDFLLLVKR